MSRLLALILFLIQVLCVEGQRRPELSPPPKPETQSSEFPAEGSPPAQLVAHPAFDLPDDFQVEPGLDGSKTPKTPGARFVKVRQGPYTIAVGQSVTEEEQWIAEPKMPCNHCYVTALQGGVEFEDGSPANVDKGAMLQVGRPGVNGIG
jgi:hypothetical protein